MVFEIVLLVLTVVLSYIPFVRSVDVCRGARAVEMAFPSGLPVVVVNTCLAGESGPATTLLHVLTGTADCPLGQAFKAKARREWSPSCRSLES